jgi:drug/metabolite transporter (DMT)-like permease
VALRSLFSDSKHRADLAMLLVTLFWGLTFPLIRSAVSTLDPLVFVVLRFSLALVVFLPFVVFSARVRRSLRAAVFPGLILGLLAGGGYITQTLGLTSISAGRAAFITGLSVILVPLLSPIFRAGRPRRIEILAALTATLGLFLLTDPRAGGITRGDLLVLACAAIYAVYIHVLQIFLRRQPDSVALAFLQIVGIAALAGACLPLADLGPLRFTPMAWVALLFTATFATGGTTWLQTHFQGRTTPQRTALIFSMEPVFATLFAYLMLGEVLSTLGQLGALLILISVTGAELLDRPKPKS